MNLSRNYEVPMIYDLSSDPWHVLWPVVYLLDLCVTYDLLPVAYDLLPVAYDLLPMPSDVRNGRKE